MKQVFCTVIAIFFLNNVHAQRFITYRDSAVDNDADPAYILSYGKSLVLRVFAGKNIAHFSVGGDNNNPNLHYVANFPPNVGFGVSYSFLTANLSFGVGNPPANKGKTSSISLQSSLYFRKWAADILIKTYKGMFLNDKNGVPSVDGYYVNPNLRSTIVGGDLWRILNPNRFSYRAMMTQNEWQQKSAGSFLVGAEIYYGNANAHDSIVPLDVTGNFAARGVSAISYVKLGPGIGYAYDFVIKRHWFIAASLVGNYDVSFNEEHQNNTKWKFALQPNYNFRIGAGYNSANWNINFQYVNNGFPVKGAITDSRYSQYSGNYRISFNRRFFMTKRKTKVIK